MGLIHFFILRNLMTPNGLLWLHSSCEVQPLKSIKTIFFGIDFLTTIMHCLLSYMVTQLVPQHYNTLTFVLILTVECTTTTSWPGNQQRNLFQCHILCWNKPYNHTAINLHNMLHFFQNKLVFSR